MASKHKIVPGVQQPTIASFLAGLVLMSVFAIAGIGGGVWAYSHISLKYQLEEKGESIDGVVLSKRQIDSRAFPSASSHAYEVSYRFSIGDRAFKAKSRVDRHVFFRLQNGGSIKLYYLSSDPDKNMPKSYRLTNMDWIFCIFGFLVGGASIVVLFGMIISKAKNLKRNTNQNK